MAHDPARRRIMQIGASAMVASALPAAAAVSAAVDRRFLTALGRSPRPPSPVGDYVPIRRSGQLLFLSTTTARTNGVPDYRGTIGGDLSIEEGRKAARAAALAMLEMIWQELGGTLAPVSQILNMIGYVVSADGFHDQASVMDGATAVMIEVFGPDIGRSSRSAIGVKAMTGRSAIGIAGTVEVRSADASEK
jgi:enamine deaminase RidA (YjgF/YER057c/UK114 family)